MKQHSATVVELGEVIKHRPEFTTISDDKTYRRVRVQLYTRGIVLRDMVPGSEIKTKQQRLCRAGDFVVAEIDAKLGGYGIIPSELEGAIVSSHYFLFDIDSSRLNKEFLGHYLRTPFFADQVRAQGSTNYAAVRPSQILRYKIPLPSLTDQNIIVENLNRVTEYFDEYTGETKKYRQILQALRKSVLAAAVRGELVPHNKTEQEASALLSSIAEARKQAHSQWENQSEAATIVRKINKSPTPTPPYPLPAGWICRSLISCTEGVVDCHNKTAPYSSKGIPIIRTTDVRNGKISVEQAKQITAETYKFWSRRCPPKAGDIIFTREAPMGEAGIVPDGTKLCLGQRTMLIRPLENYVIGEYLLVCLMEPGVLSRAGSTAIGMTVKHLRVGDVENMPIMIPPLAEQRRIVSKVKELLHMCDVLDDLLSMNEKHAAALLTSVLREAYEVPS